MSTGIPTVVGEGKPDSACTIEHCRRRLRGVSTLPDYLVFHPIPC